MTRAPVVGSSCERERGQRTTAGQAVDQADRQRAPRERAITDVDMIAGACVGVCVRDEAVAMERRLAVDIADAADDCTRTQDDQHAGDRKLEAVCDARRQEAADEDERDADDKQRDRVAEAPHQAQGGCPARGA